MTSSINGFCFKRHSGVSALSVLMVEETYQKSTEHVKAHEVDDGKVRPTRVLLSRQEVRFRITFLPIHAGKHHFMPRLPSSTPAGSKTSQS